jgi:hypothetical protein
MSVPVELVDQNPWWRDKEAIQRDKYIVALSQSRVPWDPRLKYEFQWGKDIIYTLRGPRQVGKTTLIMDMIRGLIEEVEPRRVFYYTCNLVDSPKDLVQTVSSYLDSVEYRERRVYIFLDEISSVRDWQRAIKHLVDTGKLVNATVILTGSHTLDIKRAYEKLPGRRGVLEDVPDKVLLPMKFAEYAETLNKEVGEAFHKLGLRPWLTRGRCILSITRGRLPEEVKELALYGKELSRLFNDYTLTGGTPKVIDEYLRRGEISEGVYRTYVDVVLGDIVRWNKRESYLRQVLSRVIGTLGNPVGWNTLKQGTDIASHNTVADYVDTLRDSFVLLYMHCFDASRQGPAYQKEKRVYFTDPFFFHALRAWVTGGEPFPGSEEFLKSQQNVGILVESVVAAHLVRLAFRLSKQKQLFDYENVVFYWRGKKGREVDFVLRLNGDHHLPIEVKYQSEIGKSDRFGIIDFTKSSKSETGIILSRDKLEVKGKIVTLPVWLFLTLV